MSIHFLRLDLGEFSLRSVAERVQSEPRSVGACSSSAASIPHEIMCGVVCCYFFVDNESALAIACSDPVSCF